ncbi:MAG: hypothetical protein KF901_26325 [Myxococcales bacterium]|nr:hypothetical protein [Myxococcales bacterium]
MIDRPTPSPHRTPHCAGVHAPAARRPSFDRALSRWGLVALAVATLGPSRAAASESPRFDFASHFHVRLIPHQESRDGQRVGLAELELVGRVLDGARGRVVVTATQRGAEIVRTSCRVQTAGREPMTRCNSERLPATRFDPAHPLAVRAVHVHEATDAETELYAASFPVLRYWDWVGNDARGRPQHVEQRALRLDSALGAATARQIDASVQLAWWEAAEDRSRPRATVRCRVGDGEWRAMRISGPGPWNDAQIAANRVMVGGSVREGSGETLVYQHWRVTLTDVSFSVPGGDARPFDPSAEGQWRCELRGPDAEVIRRFEWRVAEGALVPHEASASTPMASGAAIVAVGFGDRAPAAFDPALVASGYFGRGPSSAPTLVGAPPRPVHPSFTSPVGAPGASRARRR